MYGLFDRIGGKKKSSVETSFQKTREYQKFEKEALNVQLCAVMNANYCGNRFATYIYIESLHPAPKTNVTCQLYLSKKWKKKRQC